MVSDMDGKRDSQKRDDIEKRGKIIGVPEPKEISHP